MWRFAHSCLHTQRSLFELRLLTCRYAIDPSTSQKNIPGHLDIPTSKTWACSSRQVVHRNFLCSSAAIPFLQHNRCPADARARHPGTSPHDHRHCEEIRAAECPHELQHINLRVHLLIHRHLDLVNPRRHRQDEAFPWHSAARSCTLPCLPQYGRRCPAYHWRSSIIPMQCKNSYTWLIIVLWPHWPHM